MDEVTLDVERPVAGGRMLARHDGRVVFVSGTVPGERVRARLERAQGQVLWAETVAVVTPSADRREPALDAACGGLAYAHIAYPRQLALKAEIIADAFRRLGKIALDGEVAVRPSPETGYRLRARLHVRDGRAGFFREGTHTWCDASSSGQLLAATLPVVDAQIAALGPLASQVEAVIVAENIAATERVLHLETRAGAPRLDGGGRISLVSGITGVTFAVSQDGSRGPGLRSGRPDRSNRPHRPDRSRYSHRSKGSHDSVGTEEEATAGAGSARPITLAGSATVTDAARDLFGGAAPVSELAAWMRHATAFFQGNRFLTGALVRRVLDAVSADEVIDLYAGVGLFSVALAARGARVIAVEGDRLAARDLAANAGPWRERLRAVCAPVERAVAASGAAAGSVGACIVDPPRSGLSPAAMTQVLEIGAKELVYVSCDPATLARDAARLVGEGYAIEAVDAFDLFPNTPHVETIVRFLRAGRAVPARGADQSVE